MNQTPYSIYFSIRKKFAKSNDGQNHMNVASEQLQIQNDLLKQELEYEKLYNFYQSELERRRNLETEVKSFHSILESEEKVKKETAVEIKKFGLEKKSIQERFENKWFSFK